jgi:Ser-tRNA(Ala) deacylase AlaX
MVASDDVRSHTAIHILKGAVVQVLGRGAKWSSSAYSQGAHGGLTVQFDRKPTDEEMQRIEEAANTKIREDAYGNAPDGAKRRRGALGRRHLRPIPSPRAQVVRSSTYPNGT